MSVWNSKGPLNFSGRIQCLSIDPRKNAATVDNPNQLPTVYAGSASGGVWVTRNGGGKWDPLTPERGFAHAIGAMALDPDNPDDLYIATGEATGPFEPTYLGDGLYKYSSKDGSYVRVGAKGAMPCTQCTAVLAHTDKDKKRTLFVGGNAGFYRSKDNGASWECVCTGHVTDALLIPGKPNLIYTALWNSGIYVSDDLGTTWNPAGSGLPLGMDAGWIRLAKGNSTADGQYVVAKAGFRGENIFKSNVGSGKWEMLSEHPQPSETTEWANMIAVDPTTDGAIFAGAVWLDKRVKNKDGCLEFAWMRGIVEYEKGKFRGIHEDIHDLVFDVTSPGRCYLATDAGIYVSPNYGEDWTPTEGQPATTQFFSVGVSQAPGFHLGGVSQDTGVLSYNGNKERIWDEFNMFGELGRFVVDPKDNDTVYVISSEEDESELRRTKNRGDNCPQILPIEKDGGEEEGPSLISDLVIHPVETNRLYCASGDRVLRSVNQGTLWRTVLTVDSPNPADPDEVKRLAICEGEPRNHYAFTSHGEVYRSKELGQPKTWQNTAKPPRTLPKHDGTALAVSAPKPEKLYVGFGIADGPNVFHSIDGGECWEGATVASDECPDVAVPINDLLVDPRNDDKVYAATSVGVFFSDNGGKTWKGFNDGLPQVDATGLSMRLNNGCLEIYVSTMGRGVYSCSV
jgi:hypothetical protein